MGAYHRKGAPATECASVATGAQGATFSFWCDVHNHHGDPWVYGRLAGTRTQG
ncbi:hypothetical protein [Streptomyces sp. NPDC057702]|uniref:hypothetical protein n=1 Tax=unclassified Streptomyces TaxID=2593676 RepID=UPI0036804775